MVLKQQSHQLITDWVGFGEAAQSGEDKVSPPVHNLFHRSITSTNLGRKRVVPRVDTVAYGVETPTPPADSWFAGFVEPPNTLGAKVLSPDLKYFPTLATPRKQG